MLLSFVLAAVANSSDALGDDRRRLFEDEAIPVIEGLYGGAVNLTGNRPDADDLIQETVLNAYRNFHRYEPGTNLRAWLYRIMMNAFISRYRRGKRSPERANVDDVGEFLVGSTPEDQAREVNAWIELGESNALESLKEQLDDEMKAAVESLSDEFRDVLVLNVINGLTYKETAEALGVAMGTVMSRVSRAKSMIRDRLLQSQADASESPAVNRHRQETSGPDGADQAGEAGESFGGLDAAREALERDSRSL